jgi:hypothetical protein
MQPSSSVPSRCSPAGRQPDSGSLKSGPTQTCPYLGLKGFASIKLGYPAYPNACHRRSQPELVPLDQQRRVCLTGSFQICPGPSGKE